MKKVVFSITAVLALGVFSPLAHASDSHSADQKISAIIVDGDDVDTPEPPVTKPKPNEPGTETPTPGKPTPGKPVETPKSGETQTPKTDTISNSGGATFLETGAGQSTILVVGGLALIGMGGYLVLSTKKEEAQ